MMTDTALTKYLIKGFMTLSIISVTVTSFGVTPSEDNFEFGLDVQGQRINVYKGCDEGNISCDDMLLAAPDLNNLLNMLDHANTSPPNVKYYPMQSKHLLCADGITPCHFQGYSFDNKDVSGFIDIGENQIVITFNNLRGAKNQVVLYQETVYDYQPLKPDKTFIDTLYEASDRSINEGYKAVYSDLARMYDIQFAEEFKTDQIKWIKQRSKDCGANNKHLPRNQIEKACFFEKNQDRLHDYFLWVD